MLDDRVVEWSHHHAEKVIDITIMSSCFSCFRSHSSFDSPSIPFPPYNSPLVTDIQRLQSNLHHVIKHRCGNSDPNCALPDITHSFFLPQTQALLSSVSTSSSSSPSSLPLSVLLSYLPDYSSSSFWSLSYHFPIPGFYGGFNLSFRQFTPYQLQKLHTFPLLRTQIDRNKNGTSEEKENLVQYDLCECNTCKEVSDFKGQGVKVKVREEEDKMKKNDKNDKGKEKKKQENLVEILTPEERSELDSSLLQFHLPIPDLTAIILSYLPSGPNFSLWYIHADSSCRIAGGSGERHQISVHGWRLLQTNTDNVADNEE
jgi:hypothetical protein